VIFDGVISGGGGITTGGGGIIELTQNNLFTGGMLVTNATVLANNVAGSATGNGIVTVASSGTLGGNGTVANSVIGSGGRIAPGELFSVGTLTLTDTEWQGGGRYAWNIEDASGSAGTGWDFVDIASLNLTANSASRFIIEIGSDWTNAANFGSLSPSGTNSYLIASALNSAFTSTAFEASFGIVTNGFGWWVTTENNGQDLMLNYGATNTFLVIPEPNVLLLWLSSLASIYAARRRLTKRNQK